jgi:hypothetical protein
MFIIKNSVQNVKTFTGDKLFLSFSFSPPTKLSDENISSRFIDFQVDYSTSGDRLVYR